jgi:hypothetical protein
MANQPKPHEPPPPPHPHPPEPKPEAAKVEGHKAQPEPPVKTVADEQRERSEEMQKEGVDAWMAAHDERTPEDRQGKPVTGVQPGPNTAKGSTPEARAAQHPAAPR